MLPHSQRKTPLAQFMNSRWMHITIGTTALLNAILLGWMTLIPKTSNLYGVLHMMDTVILWIFVSELALRFIANGFSFFRSGWNLFDCMIILGIFFPFLDPSHGEIVRALRILRVFYFVETSKKFHKILKGLRRAFPNLLGVAGVATIFYYVFSVIGVALFCALGVKEFSDIGQSAETLFRVLTMDGWYDIYISAYGVRPLGAILFFYTFMILMAFVMLNFFIGVIVDALQKAEGE